MEHSPVIPLWELQRCSVQLCSQYLCASCKIASKIASWYTDYVEPIRILTLQEFSTSVALPVIAWAHCNRQIIVLAMAAHLQPSVL